MPTKKATTPDVVKKAPVKKATTVATKKVTKKTTGKKPLVYADNKQSFWVADGQILNSLLALKDALATMEKTIYTHHTSAGKNDFADWVEKVLCDAQCAKGLKGAKTSASAKTVVVRSLKSYTI